MTTRFISKSAYMHRLSDLPIDAQKELPPIMVSEKFPLVSLEEAIIPLKSIIPRIDEITASVMDHTLWKYNDNLTDDEAAAILLYTMDWEPREKSLYTILNSTLQATDRNLLRPWFSFLRLSMTALAKLPSEPQILTVYCGLRRNLSKQYRQGSIVTWWKYSSCTKSHKVLTNKRVLGRDGARTQFVIECYSGKSIKSFSLDLEEDEILLPPGRQFRVKSCAYNSDGLHIVKLEEIEPHIPLIHFVPDIVMQPPNCGNPRLQEHINALYLDPVNVLFAPIFS